MSDEVNDPGTALPEENPVAVELPEDNPLVRAVMAVVNKALSRYKKVVAWVSVAVLLSLGSSGWVFYKQLVHTNANRIQAQADQIQAQADQLHAQLVANCKDTNVSREQVRLTLNSEAEGQAALVKVAMFDLVTALEGSHPDAIVQAQGTRFKNRVTDLASQTVSTFEGKTKEIYEAQDCTAKYSSAKAAAPPAVSFESVYAAADQVVKALGR